MRVAVITETFLPHINGVTNSVLRVLEYLHANGHKAAITTPGTAATPRSYLGFPVTPQFSMGLPGYNQVRVAPTSSVSLERWLEDVDPDIVHLASPISIGYKGALAAARLELPCVGLYQTEVPTYASLYGFTQVESILWRRLWEIHSLCTLTLAPSTATRDTLRAHDIPRIKIWGRGVDAQLFHPDKRNAQLRASWNAQNKVVIGYVGRLAPEKRVSDLQVLADIPNVQLVLVGDGPCREELETLIPNAVFTGQLGGEELASTYASFDIFVSPGDMETFNQTIQESMAAGVPAFAPKIGGPIDLIADGKTGWLYTPGDLDELKKLVSQLVANPKLLNQMRQQARETVANRTWDSLCEQLMDYYKEAINTTIVPIS